jgi:endonuclease/exonuclease/phosphatase family metal-dependent hydrolase
MDWPAGWPWGNAARRRKSAGSENEAAFADTSDGPCLNVMSFNIRRGTAQDGRNHWVFRRSLVYEILKDYRPDVLGLQEALDFQIAEIGRILPGYKPVGIGTHRSGKGLHNAIFYDANRFILTERGTFWFSDTPDVPGSKGWGNILPRNCTWMRLVDIKSNRGFYFYNVHLDHISRRSRKKSVYALTEHLHRRSHADPFILTGDFNAREKSGPVQFLRGNAAMKIAAKGRVANPEPMVDSFRVRYPERRNTATFHGFNKLLFRTRIDYIFVAASIRVQEMEIITRRWQKRFPSDHYPLFARMVIPAGSVSGGAGTDFGEAVNE